MNQAPVPIQSNVAQASNVASVQPVAPTPPTAGVIMSAESLDLGPEEVVVGGDPILRQTGILRDGLSKIPYKPLHPVGRSRSRIRKGFGPQYSQDCYMACPGGCPPAIYGGFDILYMTNQADPVTYGSAFPRGGYDDELMGRITIGRMRDCTDGFEVTFIGLPEWSETYTATDPGNLNFRIGTSAGFPAASLDTFFNADFQSQRYESRYRSYEFNHRTWGWDVVSTLFGVKVIEYEEESSFLSQNGLGQFGEFRQSADNFLIGLHGGIDLMFPVARRMMVGSKARGGIFLNLSDVSTALANNGSVLLDNVNDETDVAFNLEYGVFATYHFMPCLAAKVGYEFWYLTNVDTIESQLQPTITSSYGLFGGKDDVLFYGPTAGVEVIF